jgi:hypothetical protein
MALDFVEPGSCQNPPQYFKDIKVYPDLHLDGKGTATELHPNSPGALHFTVGQPDLMPAGWDNKNLWIGWANGDNEIQVMLILLVFFFLFADNCVVFRCDQGW